MRSKLLQILGWVIPAIYLTFTTAYALSNVFLAITLMFFLVTLSGRYLDRDVWSWPAFWLLALWAMVLVGMTYTTAPWQWSSINLGKYSKMAYVVAVMLALYKQPNWQTRCLNAFAIGMAFVLVSTWLNIWFVLPWSSSKTPGWGLSHHVMYDYIIQNVMMSFYVVYCLVRSNEKRDRAWKALWRVLALMAVISITHLSQGRTGVAVLIPALIAYSASQWGGRRALYALPVLLVVMAAATMSSSVMRERIEQTQLEFFHRNSDTFSSIGHRLYNWKTTPQLIAEKPVFGHGTGAYHTEICRFMDKPEWCDTFRWHTHNQYLFFAADHGLVGAVLYIALIASLFVVAYRSSRRPERALLFALATILAVDSLFNSPFFSAKESEFFLYMMALLVAMCREPEPGKQTGAHK